MTSHIRNNERHHYRIEETVAWTTPAGVTVPAYGVVKLSSHSSGLFTISKPDGESGLYYVNDGVPVSPSSYKSSLAWVRSQPVLFETGASVSVGDSCGPVDDQWYMSADGSGWKVFVPPDGNDIAFVVKEGSGGSGSGAFVEGIVADTVCAAGTLDITVDYYSDCNLELPYGNVVNATDRLGIMSGHVASEFAGLIAIALRMYDVSTCTEEYRLVMLNGQGECG